MARTGPAGPRGGSYRGPGKQLAAPPSSYNPGQAGSSDWRASKQGASIEGQSVGGNRTIQPDPSDIQLHTSAPHGATTAPTPAAPSNAPAANPYPWLDMSGLGYAEQRYENTNWDAPNELGKHWEGVQGHYAPEQFDDLSPAFDAHYDRVRDKAAAGAENYFGAMGLTGSTAQGNALGNAFADIGASEAAARTKFDMDVRNQKLDYMNSGADIARGLSGELRSDRESGMRAATDAQRSAEGRKGDFVDRLFRQNSFDADFYFRGTDSNFDADQRNFDKEMEALLGPNKAAWDVSRQEQSDIMDLFATGVSVYEAYATVTGRTPPRGGKTG